MYRILIVDDEPEIRLGLRLKIDWDQLGLEVAAEAANGAEALEILGTEPIDIVITDMNMPVMNGVGLLDACQELYPVLRVIVITGYEDFHYAKAAIKHQARDYLLKPVSQDELNESLRKVVLELERDRSRRNEQELVQWKLSQYYRENKEHFLVRLVKSELTVNGSLLERSKLFELEGLRELPVRFVTAGLIRTSEGDESPGERTPDSLRVPFEMLVQEYTDTYASEPKPVVFRDTAYNGLVHMIVPAREEFFEQRLRDCVTSHLGFEPVIGAGQRVEGFPQWKEGYSSAILAWSLAAGGAKPSLSEPSEALSEDVARVLERYVTRGELEAFAKAAEQELASAYRQSRERFVKRIFQLYLLVEQAAQAAGSPLSNADLLWLRPELVWSFDTVAKAKEYLQRLAASRKPPDAEDPDRSMVASVIQFIDENYRYDLNLSMLAERYNYNPSYFSEWFKAKIGRTFIQYVTEIRMAKALRLLEDTSLTLWDIAELTGFSNASYFSSKFKKIYGVTPSEYRSRPPEKSDSEVPKK